MGNWAIVVHGVGQHHNRLDERDANRMAAKFVADLKAAGHSVVSATFTHGGADDLGDAGQYLKERDAFEEAAPPRRG